LNVATLIILRGDVVDREVDLGERTARIGRGDQNDIVLLDPANSVSRFHAELRFEHGKYLVVDLNSQNGVWAAGRRVPKATLEPGVPVVLGSYRLVLKHESPPVPAPTDATLIVGLAGGDPSSAATLIVPLRPASPPTPLSPKVETPRASTPKADPPKAEPPKPEPPKAEPPKAEPPKAEPPPASPPPPPEAPKVAPVPEPAPVAKAEPPKPPARPEPPPPSTAKPQAAAKPANTATRAGKGVSKGLLYGGIAVLLLAVAAAAVFLTPLKSQLAELIGGKPAGSPTAVPPAAVAEVGATPAPPEGPRPQAPPAVTPSPEAKPPVVPPPTNVGAPKPAVVPPPTPAAAPKPAAAPAGDAKAPGQAPPPVRTPAGTAGARRGGAAPAGEPKPKPLNLAQTLEEARSAMIKGDYLAAIAGFESILAVDPNYPVAGDLLGVARGGAKNASQLAVDTGNKAEMGGDYAGAQKQYERALQLDPQSTAAPDAMRRL
jgi:pSer/pThr/pTyr-binding forkhead associated (FHA) protein